MLKKVLGLVLVVMFFSGCTNYYKIVDPESSKAYYTTDYDKQRNGAIAFEDAATGSTITIQNSEITEISKESFKQETSK